MTMDMLIVHEVALFSGRTPNSQQVALGTDATANICANNFVPSDIEGIVRMELISMSIDNPWVVEGIRDYSSTEEMRGALARMVVREIADRNGLSPQDINENVFRFGTALAILSYMDKANAPYSNVFQAASNVLLGKSNGMTEVNPGRIIPVVLASMFAIEFHSYNGVAVLDSNAEIRPMDASHIEHQWEAIQPILPELIKRRTLDQGTIDILMGANTVTLCEGEL